MYTFYVCNWVTLLCSWTWGDTEDQPHFNTILRKEQECPLVLLTPCFFPSDTYSLFSLLRMQVLLWYPHNPNCIKNLFLLEYSWLTIFWVSGGHQMDSIVCSYVSWSQRYPSNPGCHITERISLCYKVTHCWLSILNIAVPTTRSWRLNSGTLGSLLQPTLTPVGHSRLGWVMYFGSPFPQVSL